MKCGKNGVKKLEEKNKDCPIFFYACTIKGQMKYCSNMDSYQLKVLSEYINDKQWLIKNKEDHKTVGECA